jgi:hypothetical protein
MLRCAKIARFFRARERPAGAGRQKAGRGGSLGRRNGPFARTSARNRACTRLRNLTSHFATLEYSLVVLRNPTSDPEALVLPPFIIEQIRQREEQERLRREADRPRIQLPVDALWPRKPVEKEDDDDAGERGVAILEL